MDWLWTHHIADLLQRQTLCLGDKDPGEESAEETCAAPDKEDFDAQTSLTVDDERGDDTDDAVPEPVGGCAECDGFAAERELEDLADDDPGCWSL